MDAKKTQGVEGNIIPYTDTIFTCNSGNSAYEIRFSYKQIALLHMLWNKAYFYSLPLFEYDTVGHFLDPRPVQHSNMLLATLQYAVLAHRLNRSVQVAVRCSEQSSNLSNLRGLYL